jgi:hypothetical protein
MARGAFRSRRAEDTGAGLPSRHPRLVARPPELFKGKLASLVATRPLTSPRFRASANKRPKESFGPQRLRQRGYSRSGRNSEFTLAIFRRSRDDELYPAWFPADREEEWRCNEPDHQRRLLDVPYLTPRGSPDREVRTGKVVVLGAPR